MSNFSDDYLAKVEQWLRRAAEKRPGLPLFCSEFLFASPSLVDRGGSALSCRLGEPLTPDSWCGWPSSLIPPVNSVTDGTGSDNTVDQQWKRSNSAFKHKEHTTLWSSTLTIRIFSITVLTAASTFSVTSSAVIPEWPIRAMLRDRKSMSDRAKCMHKHLSAQLLAL